MQIIRGKKMFNLFNKVAKSFPLKHYLSNYQWYRKWYGGRWEKHYIEICASSMWLDMKPPKVWPDYIQPCSRGTPEIEDYTQKSPD